jgi:hypothetical protein
MMRIKITNYFDLLRSALYLCGITIFLSSCVGVIQEFNPPVTKGSSVEPPPLDFLGVQSTVAIAHDKIEVFFFPAEGDVRELTYIVSYDGAPAPLTYPGESLREDYRGMLKVTITGLEINTLYNINVQVMNDSGRRSDVQRSQNVRTFANRTANFNGIATLRNTAGTDGLTSLYLSWPEAERRGTLFVPNEIDVVEYVITAVDSEFLTPGDLNNKNFSRPYRYEFVISGMLSSRVITGLQPGREYHVQVRAIHKGFKDFAQLTGYRAEQNTNYLTISTLSPDSNDIEYNPSIIKANRFNGSLGLTSINVEWDNVVGAFDHFRVYYNTTKDLTFTTAGAIVPSCSALSPIPCKKIRFDRNSTIVTDLVPLQQYEVNVVICVDIDCNSSFLFERKTTVTDPGIATYGGITSFQNPRNPSRLDEIYLITNPPDVTSGNIDGLLVEIKARQGSGPFIDTILNHPEEPNTSILTLGEFYYENVTEIAIKGVNTSTSTPYCFSIFPFVYVDNQVVEKRANEVTRCHTPQLETPSADEFKGIADLIIDSDTNTVDIFWDSPTRGLATHVRVFVRTDGGTFNFSEAISNHSAYVMYSASVDANQLTIPFIPSGTYTFGALTYIDALEMSSIPGKAYSEFNLSTVTESL